MTTAASLTTAQLRELATELGAPMDQAIAAEMALWLGLGSELGQQYHAICARLITERNSHRRAA